MNAEFVCHAYGKIESNVFTPKTEVFCQLTNPVKGLYRVTTANNDVAIGDLKVTINALKAGVTLIKNLYPNTNAITNIVITDDAGVAEDADELWVTVERVPRVQ